MTNAPSLIRPRRCPALLLVIGLLFAGALVTRTPPHAGGVDVLTAHVPVLRAPDLRQPTTGPSPVALPAVVLHVPFEILVSEAPQPARPPDVVRATARPSHHSRAPPASR
jgi:hypothetical protein